MFDTVMASRPLALVELNRKVRVRLNPTNLVTSKHSSEGPHESGMFPVEFRGGPPVKSEFLGMFRTTFVEFDRRYLAPVPLPIVPFQSNLRNVVLPVPLGMLRE